MGNLLLLKEKLPGLLLLSVICSISAVGIGCGGKPEITEDIEYTPKVTLGPGDVLDIKFYRTPELNEIQTVRPDGCITLQLIGEVNVMGNTPQEVHDSLIIRYSSQLNDPGITVTVQSLYSNRVYISGEVNGPGYIETSGRITALEAIMESGGFNLLTANVKNVLVIRSKDGERYGHRLNLKPALNGQTDQPYYLEPYDIVYVPRTKAAVIDQWIDTHIDGLFPQILVGTFGIYLVRDIITQ